MLVVSCLSVATLDIIEKVPPESSTPDKRESDPYVAGGFMIDAVCRTLCCNRFILGFAKGYTPLASESPTFQKSKKYMLNLVDREKVPIAYWRYVDQVALFYSSARPALTDAFRLYKILATNLPLLNSGELIALGPGLVYTVYR